MIYLLLIWEFFQIGLFAIGGGLVTVPFLFNLAQKYPWFSAHELADMIAVSQSTPGPLGINMATYAGYKAAGITGGITATLAEVLPSVIIIYFIAKIMKKWAQNAYVQKVLTNIRPAVLALILYSGIGIGRLSVQNTNAAMLLLALVACMRYYRASPIFYIVFSALLGLFIPL